MARTLKDDVMLKTIRDWASITGHSDAEILKWTVKELREKLREAQGETGAYWSMFLRALKKNLEETWFEVFSSRGYTISEVVVMTWPKALAEPASEAANIELDEAADQIVVTTL